MDRQIRGSESYLEKAGWAFLFIFVASDLFSISIAQIAAAGMGLSWIGMWIKSGERPDFSPIKWPLAAFIAASLIAAVLSLNRIESIRDSKDLLHIIIFFAAYGLLCRNTAKIGALFRLIVGVGGGIALVGLYQALKRGVDIYDRISGFNDIYMTYAGLLMLAITLGLAILLFDYKKRRDLWVPLAVTLMLAAVVLSLTRNAWIGLLAGAIVLIALRKPLALAAIPVVVAIAMALAPGVARDRVFSMFDLENRSNKERLYLWSAGIKIVKDNPLFGVGQNSFPIVYPKYRHPDVHEPNISHLHNNFMEIAAERGLVGLAAWISIWAAALWVMAKAWRKREPGNSSGACLGVAAGIGGITAFLCSGMFEYNFGDSEIQMLFYFIMAAGLASARARTGLSEDADE